MATTTTRSRCRTRPGGSCSRRPTGRCSRASPGCASGCRGRSSPRSRWSRCSRSCSAGACCDPRRSRSGRRQRPARVRSTTSSRRRTRRSSGARAELARSNAELEQFASIASHDLQEPLRKVRTFTQQLTVIDADHLSEKGRDYLERANAAAERMQRLIEDLLQVLARGDPRPAVRSRSTSARVTDEVLERPRGSGRALGRGRPASASCRRSAPTRCRCAS